MGKRTYIRYLLSAALLSASIPALAGVGVTDYSGGANALADMYTHVLLFMEITVNVCYAIASLISLYAATSIYIKMNTGEEGFVKAVFMLVGGILFLLACTAFWQHFFNYNYGPSPLSLPWPFS